MNAPLMETHVGGVIRTTMPPGEWGSVPHALVEDSRLELDTRAVAVWLATRPAGWQISIPHLLKSLNLGRDRWRRIARDLESNGYLRRNATPNGPGGRWVWEIIFCSIPSPTGDGFPGDGVPGDGPGGDKNKQEMNKKETKNRERSARARAEGAEPPRSLASRGMVLDEKTGVMHSPGNLRDEEAMAQISKFPSVLITQATAAARALDVHKRAFPSATLHQLLKMRHKRNDDTPAWAMGSARGQAADPAGDGRVIDGGVSWRD